MVLYDHTTNTAHNTSQDNEIGYVHGALHHIGPFKDHKGLLLALMAKKYPLSLSFIDYNSTQGKSVSKI